jgi:electron transport complex protein RnfG
MIRVMGVVSLVCGLLIVTTHLGTLEPIRRNQEILTGEAVAELLPGVQKQVTYYAQASGELAVGNGSATAPAGSRLIAGYGASGQLLGVVIEARERGYADMITGMYAYSPEQQAIVGFKVVELKETPGLGDKIVTDATFLANFRKLEARLDEAGQKLLHAIVTVKNGTKKNPWEIDAISGATISSRAVGRMLHKSAEQLLPVITKNRSRIERGE